MAIVSTAERLELINNLLNHKYHTVSGKIYDSDRASLREILSDRPCDIKNLVEQLGMKRKLLGEGTYGKVYGICTQDDCDFRSALVYKITTVDFDATVRNPLETANAEIEMLRLMQPFLLSRQTPHLPLLIADFLCSKSDKEAQRYVVLEYGQSDLQKYLRDLDMKIQRNTDVIQVLVFQIIWTLAVIQRRYPAFRHNDLKWANILLIPAPHTGYTTYTWEGQTYYIPNIGVSTIISDFGLASIGDVLPNYATIETSFGNYGIDLNPNRFVDITKIFYWIWKNRSELPKKLGNFVKRRLPLVFRRDPSYMNYMSPVIDYEISTCEDMLKDDIFTIYQKPRANVTAAYSLVGEPALGFTPARAATYSADCDYWADIYLTPYDKSLWAFGRERCILPDDFEYVTTATAELVDKFSYLAELNWELANVRIFTEIRWNVADLVKRLETYIDVSLDKHLVIALCYNLVAYYMFGVHNFSIYDLPGYEEFGDYSDETLTDIYQQIYWIILKTDIQAWLMSLRYPLRLIVELIEPFLENIVTRH